MAQVGSMRRGAIGILLVMQASGCAVLSGLSDLSEAPDDAKPGSDSGGLDSQADSSASDSTTPIDSSSIDAPSEDAGTATWTTNALAYDCTQSGVKGLHVHFVCPPSGSAGVIRGTGVYPSDSSVCTAAVHAGRITLADGGPIVIEMMAGLSGYDSSLRNGLYSSASGATICAFAVIGPSCVDGTLTDCGDLCADLTSDKLACGSCTKKCTSPTKCMSSTCM